MIDRLLLGLLGPLASNIDWGIEPTSKFAVRHPLLRAIVDTAIWGAVGFLLAWALFEALGKSMHWLVWAGPIYVAVTLGSLYSFYACIRHRVSAVAADDEDSD